MKSSSRLLTFCFLLVVVAACTNASQSNDLPNGGNTNIAATSTVQPTEIPLPADLSRASTMLRWMDSSGLKILSVQHSMDGALFPYNNQAAWIQTDQGIVDVVFFLDPTETDHIQVTSLSNQERGRYLYKLQAPLPTIPHDVTIDAAWPLYFTVQRGMFMVTSSAELDKTLKRILAKH